MLTLIKIINIQNIQVNQNIILDNHITHKESVINHGPYFGSANGPIDQGPIHLTLFEIKYKNRPHAKSRLQSIVSSFYHTCLEF